MMARGPDSPPFRLDRSAFHIAVDMQLLFAEVTEWFVPWLPRVLPNVVAIARRHPDRTLLTRYHKRTIALDKGKMVFDA